MTERQFNELMCVPLTFFYMRVRQDSTSESSYGGKTSQISELASSKTGKRHVNPSNQETGVDETKHTSTFSPSKQTALLPNGGEIKSMAYSQSTNTLDSTSRNLPDVISETNQSLKMLSWSGRTPSQAVQSKKLLGTSMSSLSLREKQSKHGVLLDSVARSTTNRYHNDESITDGTEFLRRRMKGSEEASMSTGYSVYDLEMATQDTIDPRFYFTLSKEGVTQYSNKSSHFTPLGQWHREFLVFHRISAIRCVSILYKWIHKSGSFTLYKESHYALI